MRPILALLVLLAPFPGAGCGGEAGPEAVDGSPGDGPPVDGSLGDGLRPVDVQPAQEAFLTELASAEALDSLRIPETPAVKYLLPMADRPALEPLTKACYFQNMHRYPWHLQFLRSFPQHADMTYDAYLALVLGASSRRLWGGAVSSWPAACHPGSGGRGVIAYGVYGEPGSLTRADVVEVDRTLASCMPFAADLLVFVPGSNEQVAFLDRERAALAAQGVFSLYPAALMAAAPQEGRNPCPR